MVAEQWVVVEGVTGAVFLVELVEQPVGHFCVPIYTAQMVIAACGYDFDGSLVDEYDGNIECAASEVVDEYGFTIFDLGAVGYGCGCGLVDDGQHIEPGYDAGLLGLHALFVAKIGRAGYNNVLDGFGVAVGVIGVLNKFLEYES